MSAAAMTPRAIAALGALRASGQAAARAERSIASLIDKLSSPVRVGIFGLPGAGKTRLAGSLGGVPLSDMPQPVPTLELSHGVCATRAMLADGSLLEHDGLPDAAMLAQAPVFLGIKAPAPELAGRSLLMVASEAQADDIAAALDWAAPRVDICLWCTRDWSAFEAALWQGAPDRLRNHALLVWTGPGDAPCAEAAEAGFDAVFPVGPGDGASALARLSDHLGGIIDEAATQDILAARLLLQRYGCDIADQEPEPSAEIIAHPATARHASPEARAELARLFQLLRSEADALRQAPEPDDAFLASAEALLETLSQRAGDLDHLEEAWPELPLLFTEARDLALLLRMESGAGQCVDAARLLLQVRQEMEVMLAA
ncbi:MAG: hypothetical protein EP318_04355 [Rhodobacteraceae bacterium]|nr:MAG: hypothetical protein EP318_04355 [Paracoccaceae bacterium]